MRRLTTFQRIVLLKAVLAIFCAVAPVIGQVPGPWSQNTSPLPAPTGFVNDYAGVIDPGTKQQLENKLKQFKETTSPSVEIAVVTVKTTGDRAIFDYSLAVARGWKIGSKQDDNPSALLLIAVDDRPRFFGPLRPQLETLERLIRAQMTAADPSPLTDRSVSELADRILAAKART